jgi:multicomponent Na+:H+ antiporter subunit G
VTAIGQLLLVSGGLVMLIAAVGLFVLPDALARQHAATKAATLGVTAIVGGIAVLGADLAWWWRAGVLVLVLFATLPVSSHMLARAGVGEPD